MTLLALAGLLALAAPTLTQESGSSTQLVNGGFEQDGIAGWQLPEPCRREGFAASASSDDPRAGEHCALLEYTRAGRPQGFGNLVQAFAAQDLRGKRVRLRAAVRTAGGGRAQLWLRTDGKEGFTVLVDNMSARPIQAAEWASHDILADVDPRTDRLVLGMMLFDGGQAFLDEVSVTVLGETSALAEPPRPLTERGLCNLVAFARFFGYVRHFHPSDQTLRLDWNRVAIAGTEAIEGARDDVELAQRLQEFFAPIAPTALVFPSSAPPPVSAALAPPEKGSLRLVRWRSLGFGQENSAQSGIYSRNRDIGRPKDGAAPEDWKLPAEAYEAELVPGVTGRVPTVLWRDDGRTLPQVEVPASWSALSEDFLMSADDRRTRLAAVVVGWNVFQHFYPYFDVTEVDWPKELERALGAAATDADPWAFQATLQRMVAALRDGHGSVLHGNEVRGLPEVCWDWIEDELVVLAPSPDGRLAPGDVVVGIDGVATKTAFEREAPRLSAATPQYLRYRSRFELGAGPPDAKVTLEVRSHAGETRKLEVARSLRPPEEPRPAKIAELEPGLWYVDLERIDDADFAGALEDLAGARGIVFDVRGYPRVSPKPLAHLIEEPIESARWLVPLVLYPDREGTTFRESSWNVEPESPRITAKVAFLTDGRAISYAETFLGLVEQHHLAPIVGEPTAGTNGNVNPFVLPGGYEVRWTGMKVLKQDGSRHHGVGIQPTVPCARTLAGVAAGRDEQLEKALETVR